MILTCPECATGYFVKDDQIRSKGRSVRCANCGARWIAYPETPESASGPEPHEPEAAPPEPVELAPAPEPAAAEESAAEPTAEAPAPLAGDDLPKAFRSRAEEERRLRRAAFAGAIWAGAAVVLAALVGAALLFREDVVRAWPQTASAYAAIGLPVNPVGLVIEQVKAEPSLQNGHATLAVSGVIRSVTDRSITAPPLRISLLNGQGKAVAGQIDALANARVPPGETRHFVTAIVDPPFSAQVLQVDFALDAKGKVMRPPPVTTPVASPAFALRGSTPAAAAPQSPAVDAQPLPPDAPPPPDSHLTPPADAPAANAGAGANE
jgi:predicted Zn finger-like uncharacterized protein